MNLQDKNGKKIFIFSKSRKENIFILEKISTMNSFEYFH